MATEEEIEELRARLERLEMYFQHHYHDGFNGLSTPKFDTFCPKCKSIEDAVERKKGVWVCPDCGRIYKHGDYYAWFYGKPCIMPKGELEL